MRSSVVLLLLTSALLSGCELIADFDRSKLVTDAGVAGDGDGDGDGDAGDGDAGETPAPDAAVDEDAGL